jgi:hypothetical protein
MVIEGASECGFSQEPNTLRNIYLEFEARKLRGLCADGERCQSNKGKVEKFWAAYFRAANARFTPERYGSVLMKFSD